MCVMHLEEDSQMYAFDCCLNGFLFQLKAVSVVLGNKIEYTEGMWVKEGFTFLIETGESECVEHTPRW